MSYKKTVWEDFVTPLDENNMNNIENGIEHVDQEVHKTQADLRETKNHLAQTDINVATNKQAIIDLEAKHDEDIKNLDDKYTKEINDTNAEVATKLPKQNIDILKDVNIEVNGDQAFITKTTVNLNEDTLEPVEQTATQIIPDATEQQSGLMTKATVKAINQMQEQIEQLQGKTTRLLYTASENPTAAEINAFVITEGYTEPFDGIAVVIDKTYHIWHFYEGGTGWKDDGLDTVTTFTNDIAGIIKGSNDDGKVYANADGTGSVKGWDVVKQNIANNTQAIAQRATLTQLAATNQNLTNLTNHVDDVEEQLQQNITNGNNALDTKITNLNNKTLQLSTTAPTKQVVVTITTENAQQNLTTDNFVMTTAQILTSAQKIQARRNLDIPTTLFDGSYTSLGNKPVLNTDNSTTLATSGAEEINGIMNLHKISKTGKFSDLNDIPSASETVAGIIQIASDTEAETGTNTLKAVNPKQLKTAIDGLGSVFTLKGSVQSITNLPTTGNVYGDVYYVIDESVGYVWLNDGTTDRWEQLGLPIDLSTYVQFTDIVNNLTSELTDKPLSAYQGKVLDSNKVNKTVTFNGLTAEIDMLETGGQLQLSCSDGSDENLFDVASTYTRSAKPLYIENWSEDNKVVIKSELQTADSQNVKISGDQSVSGTKNFSTMPKVSSSPIIESNSNANGYWVRFADGTQICQGRFKASGAHVATLANAFIDTNYILILGSESSSSATSTIRTFGCTARTTSTFTKGTTSASLDFNYIAIGKWK